MKANADLPSRVEARNMKRRRRRREGCVYRRGQVFWLKWADGFGITRYRSSGSADRTIAENMLRDELKRKADGLGASPDPRRTLVDDLLEALKNRYRVEGRRSLERLEDAVEHLLRMFRGVSASRVKGADVLRYANLRLEEKAKAATINRELAALRAAYRLGLDNDTIVAMPRIRLLPENNARQGFADTKQVATICRHLSPDLADAVQFMFITGWRSRSEVLPLRWAQVDFAGGFVRLEPGTAKNNEGRAFPLIPELRALVERRLAITRRCERAQGRIIAHVFHRSGNPIRSLRRAWKTACTDAGRPGLLLHDLRRSAVRNVERAGISRSVAMKLTGHKTEAVYRRYAIVAEGDLREAGTKLAASLGTMSATTSSSDSSGDTRLPSAVVAENSEGG
jgi:integrase